MSISEAIKKSELENLPKLGKANAIMQIILDKQMKANAK